MRFELNFEASFHQVFAQFRQLQVGLGALERSACAFGKRHLGPNFSSARRKRPAASRERLAGFIVGRAVRGLSTPQGLHFREVPAPLKMTMLEGGMVGRGEMPMPGSALGRAFFGPRCI